MGKLIFFPVQARNAQDDWETVRELVKDEFKETFRELEKRLGGAKIADLENGDGEALRIATRSLRKEFMKLASQDVERGGRD